jgi:phosphoglycerol transferase MdoB-like AlkP superfamily enzyme
VTSQIDLPPTIMGILGSDYRSAFFGNDVLRNHVEDNFAICIYNKKRYGVVSDHELIVVAETGEKISYERDGANRNWQRVTFSPAQTKQALDASALLQVAEELLVSNRYTTAKS